MPEILFIDTRTVNDGREETTYRAGRVYDLPATSVARWLRRAAATDDPEKIAEVKKAREDRVKARDAAKKEADDMEAARLAKEAADAKMQAETDAKAKRAASEQSAATRR